MLSLEKSVKLQQLIEEAKVMFTEHKAVMLTCFITGFVLGALIF